ncbi:5'-nucleotidase [Bradyrhizobium sp. USDA 336]|uniref:5'-nucleotidase n=1 Tax=Bradyrhizobium sp. USDA 336 TaxID=3156311 RepID=UPI00384EB8B3
MPTSSARRRGPPEGAEGYPECGPGWHDLIDRCCVRIRTATARNAPAHARVVHTLRDWGTPADEAHFVGVRSKGPILKALGAHIFFDDQIKHVLGAAGVVPAGHVPGPLDPDEPIIPAGL